MLYKRRILGLMIVVAVCFFSIWAGEVCASSEAITVLGSWGYSRAACDCAGCGSCFADSFYLGYPGSTPSTCTCGPNANGTWITTNADAHTAGSISCYSRCNVALEDWAWGKGGKQVDSVGILVNWNCVVAHLSANLYEMRTQGIGWLSPSGANDRIWAAADVSIFESGNPNNQTFWGKIYVNPGGVSLLGGYEGSPIDFVVQNDTSYFNFDVYDTVQYAGAEDSVAVRLFCPDRAANVPTSSEWGLVFLVLILVFSGIFLLLRRRKLTVSA